MIKGAFGIEVSNGRTLFNEGQRWIQGSSQYFLEQLAGRDMLEGAFPVLKVSGERMVDSWPNSEGVIYLRYLPKGESWALVHVYQPEFSIQRAVPVWLCQRIPAARFRSEMLLHPAVSMLVRARKELVTLERGASPWLTCGDPAADAPESVDDFRTAAALFERFHSNGSIFRAALDARAFWRGLQVFVAGYAQARQAVWISIVLEPNAPEALSREGGPLLKVVTVRAAEVPPAPPVFARGVKDEEFLVTGSTPTDLIAECWGSVSSRAGRRCADVIQPPIALLPPAEVHDDEIDAWAGAVWDNEVRAHGRVAELVRDSRERGWTPASRMKLVSLLLKHPAARRGARSELAQFLSQRFSPGRQLGSGSKSA